MPATKKTSYISEEDLHSYTFVPPGCLILRTESCENVQPKQQGAQEDPNVSFVKEMVLPNGKVCTTRELKDTEYLTRFRVNRNKQVDKAWTRAVQESLTAGKQGKNSDGCFSILQSRLTLLLLQMAVFITSVFKLLTAHSQVLLTVTELCGAVAFVVISSFQVGKHFETETYSRKTHAGRTYEYTRGVQTESCVPIRLSSFPRHLFLYHIKSFVLCTTLLATVIVCGVLHRLNWTCLSTNICLMLEVLISNVTAVQLEKLASQIKQDQMKVLLLESLLIQQELLGEGPYVTSVSEKARKFYKGVQHTDAYKDLCLSYFECDPQYMHIMGRREGDGQSITNLNDLSSDK